MSKGYVSWKNVICNNYITTIHVRHYDRGELIVPTLTTLVFE